MVVSYGYGWQQNQRCKQIQEKHWQFWSPWGCDGAMQGKLPNGARGSSTRLLAIFFFLAGTIFFEASPNHKTDRQATKRETISTTHINRSIALAKYCMPINHNIQLHQCQLPLIHNLATVKACWITFNMPWQLRILAFFAAGAVMSKNLACTHNLRPGNQPTTQRLW